MRRLIACGLSGCAALMAGTVIVAAPGQDRPGQPTQARVWIENRSNSEAVPVNLVNDSSNTPLRVQVTGSPAVTIGGSITLPTRAVRQNWEYQVVAVPFGQDPTTTLQPLGLQGWEATGSQLPAANGGVLLVLKRPQ